MNWMFFSGWLMRHVMTSLFSWLLLFSWCFLFSCVKLNALLFAINVMFCLLALDATIVFSGFWWWCDGVLVDGNIHSYILIYLSIISYMHTFCRMVVRIASTTYRNDALCVLCWRNTISSQSVSQPPWANEWIWLCWERERQNEIMELLSNAE